MPFGYLLTVLHSYHCVELFCSSLTVRRPHGDSVHARDITVTGRTDVWVLVMHYYNFANQHCKL